MIDTLFNSTVIKSVPPMPRTIPTPKEHIVYRVNKHHYGNGAIIEACTKFLASN